MGNSGSTVTGVPHPVGAKLGQPRIWKWLQVIW